MDHPTTIRLKASIQTLVFVILLAATLFGSAGRFDIIEFWVYIAIVVGASVSSLIILDSDLMQERMQPGGHRVGLHFLPLTIVIFCLGLDCAHLGWTARWLLAGFADFEKSIVGDRGAGQSPSRHWHYLHHLYGSPWHGEMRIVGKEGRSSLL
jgi:hypothetical protein